MIKECIVQLNEHRTTSTQLLSDSIEKHETFKEKNAVAVLSPLAKTQATLLDQERAQGNIRSRLHGIPILIKDNICYADGTPTTANSYALHDFYPKTNATIVDRLIKAGLVILGKANLSEFAYFMSEDHMPSGYGSMYGQVKHATYETIDPLGSSTGSAVAVKLGITPLSIGTETNGSLMAPAFQNQIVSLKPTFGLLPSDGIIPISPVQDTAGPMGNSVEDVSILLDILTEKGLNTPYYSDFDDHQKGKVGWVNFKGFQYDPNRLALMNKTKESLTQLGYEVIQFEIALPKLSNMKTLVPEFKYSLDQFLKLHQDETQQNSLEKIVSFNLEHKERCLVHGQTILEKALKYKGDLTDQAYLNARKKMLQAYSSFDTLLIENELIALFTPIWLSYAPIYGNPSLCIPMGIHDHKPTGVVFVGKKMDEKSLLNLGYHFEKQME